MIPQTNLLSNKFSLSVILLTWKTRVNVYVYGYVVCGLRGHPAACALIFFILRVCACNWKQTISTLGSHSSHWSIGFSSSWQLCCVCAHICFPSSLQKIKYKETWTSSLSVSGLVKIISLYTFKKMTSLQLKALLLGVLCRWNSLKGSDSKSEWVMIWTRWSIHLNDWRHVWEWTKWEDTLPGYLEFLSSPEHSRILEL